MANEGEGDVIAETLSKIKENEEVFQTEIVAVPTTDKIEISELLNPSDEVTEVQSTPPATDESPKLLNGDEDQNGFKTEEPINGFTQDEKHNEIVIVNECNVTAEATADKVNPIMQSYQIEVDIENSDDMDRNELTNTQEASSSDITQSESVNASSDIICEEKIETVSQSTDDIDGINNDSSIESKSMESNDDSINIEEALGTPDTTEPITLNNNMNGEHNLLDSKQLLAILEGNDEKTEKQEKDEKENTAESIKSTTRKRNSKGAQHLTKSSRRSRNSENTENGETNDKPDIIKNLVDEWGDDDVAEKTSEPTTKDSETPTQRRISRVIKKKVMYDPDNPPTFTSPITKQKATENNNTEHTPPKRLKIESSAKSKVDSQTKPKVEAAIRKVELPAKTKNDSGKTIKTPTQWKKPQAKKKSTPSKETKIRRVSEVDRLLMDEGAVNMIYQVENTNTEDNRKKTMKLKAAFIKKSVISKSNTPITMKFRERKGKDQKQSEEAVPTRRTTPVRQKGKGVGSSQSVAEDYYRDSIIYRRHSSSSYSSSCMSPRRLSDFDLPKGEEVQSEPVKDIDEKFNLILKDETIQESRKPPFKIDKKSCLTLKEKLNTKLSKRLTKHNISPLIVKQVAGKVNKTNVSMIEPVAFELLKHLTVDLQGKIVYITLKKLEENGLYSLDILQELHSVLKYLNNLKDIGIIIVIKSESGDFWPGIDVSSLSVQVNSYIFPEHLRAVFESIGLLNKLLCVCVSGKCKMLGISMLTMCDVVVASSDAEFDFTGLTFPGVMDFTTNSVLKHSMLVGSKMSASEAQSNGLVTKVFDADSYKDEMDKIIIQLSEQTNSTLLLKKQYLNADRTSQPNVFQQKLNYGKNVLVQYVTSDVGQKSLSSINGQ